VTTDPLVVEILRSGVVESTHLVDVALVDATGSLLAAAGDPMVHAALRSSVKPIQARAARAAGWTPASQAHLAIACASHNAEPAHLRAVRHVLAEAGLDETALACPSAWPFLPRDVAGAGRERRAQHNCSGKHAGFLAACVAAGWPLETYLEPEHPLQVGVRAAIEAATGMRALDELVDGCGAPTLVFPVAAIARMFASVHGTTEADAMRAHPFLIAGSERLDTALLSAGIVTKAGAEGLSCATFEHEGRVVGLALKVRDGTTRARVAACTHLLVDLGALDRDAIEPSFLAPPTLGGGHPVGAAIVRGELTFA